MESVTLAGVSETDSTQERTGVDERLNVTCVPSERANFFYSPNLVPLRRIPSSSCTPARGTYISIRNSRLFEKMWFAGVAFRRRRVALCAGRCTLGREEPRRLRDLAQRQVCATLRRARCRPCARNPRPPSATRDNLPRSPPVVVGDVWFADCTLLNRSD